MVRKAWTHRQADSIRRASRVRQHESRRDYPRASVAVKLKGVRSCWIESKQRWVEKTTATPLSRAKVLNTWRAGTGKRLARFLQNTCKIRSLGSTKASSEFEPSIGP